jgi:hypothetical protein
MALTVLAAALGALTITAFAVADTNTSSSAPITSTAGTTSTTNQPQFDSFMMMNQGFGGSMRGPSGHDMMDNMGMQGITVSSYYIANVTAILNKDTDVASLIANGYNVTAINPEVKTIIQGDGNATTSATTATVFMQGTLGYATVNVDVANAKVTQIVTVTRTVIDKSTA